MLPPNVVVTGQINDVPIGGGWDLADKVPTARQDKGKWITGQMPSSDLVIQFAGKLTIPYSAPVSEAGEPKSSAIVSEPGDKPGAPTSPATWWRTFQPSDAPTSTWAITLDDGETALLNQACLFLSGNGMGQFVLTLKSPKTAIYPADWGSEKGQYRSTTERLFDRLRINHRMHDGKLTRWYTWTNVNGVVQEPQVTCFARALPTNAFVRLRLRLSDSSTLGSVVGLTAPPDAFALPLAWGEAVHSGLGKDVLAELPDDTKRSLNKWADDLEKAIGKGADAIAWGSVVAALTGTLLGSPALGAILGVLGAEVSVLEHSLSGWPAALRAAADANANLNDSAYHLLEMLRSTQFKGLFGSHLESALNLDKQVFVVGTTPDDTHTVEYAMRPDKAPKGFPAAILLGDVFAEYANQFGAHPKVKGTPFVEGDAPVPSVAATQQDAARLWTTWWNDAQPTLDLAYLIDTASMVLEQLVNIDDALLAAADLALGDGLVAAIVRRGLVDQGLDRYVDALAGVSPGGAIRYLFRQLMTDQFIDWIGVKQGVKASDVHPIFRWMNSETKRASIDDVLGPIAEATDEAAGSMSALVSGFRLLFGYAAVNPYEPMQLRGAFLAGLPDDQRGALGRAISAISANSSSPTAAAKAVSYADLGMLRGWLELARASDLVDIHGDLEPDWSPHSSSGVDIPGNFDPTTTTIPTGPADHMNPGPTH